MVAYARTPKLTPAEYLELERTAETRSEYYDGYLVAMAGSSEVHDRTIGDIYVSIGVQLRGSSCEFFTGNMRVNVADCNCYFYPDATIVCGGAQFQRISGVQSLTNPTVIFEVLSESTESIDRDHKMICYQTLPSLTTYIIVAQDRPLIQVYDRQSDGTWSYSYYQGLDAVVSLPAISCRLKLADVYARVEFSPDAGNPAMRIMEERARYGDYHANP